MEIKTNKTLYACALLLYAAALYALPRYGHSWDTYCWEQWTALIKKHGLGAAYADGSPVNYLPLFLYILRGFSFLVTHENMHDSIYLLKSVSLLFDFGSAILIVRMLPDSGKKTAGLFLLAMLNPGFFYNTYIWNQVDGVLSFFILLSFHYALRKKVLLSAIAFLLAFNFKLQAIVFLPLVGLIWLPELRIKQAAVVILVLAALQGAIVLPFVLERHGDNMIAVVFNSVDYFSFVSMNAFNLWHFVYEGDLTSMQDNVRFLGPFSAKQTGLILFFCGSGLVLAPVIIRSVKRLLNPAIQPLNRELIFVTASLIICFFFYFNTQMHERYIHPLLVFSTALAMVYGKWLQWIVFSICYVLSLESILHYTGYKLIPEYLLQPKFLAATYGAGILLLFMAWLRLKPFKST